MFDYMELVDDSLTVLEGFLNPLAETERHVAGDETDSFRIASVASKSAAKCWTVVESLPSVTKMTLRWERSATTVM